MELENDSYEFTRIRNYINSIKDMILLKFIFKIDNIYDDFTYDISEDYLNKRITMVVGFFVDKDETSNEKYLYIMNTIFNVVSEVSRDIFIESIDERSINNTFISRANKSINRRAIININCGGKQDGKELEDRDSKN